MNIELIIEKAQELVELTKGRDVLGVNIKTATYPAGIQLHNIFDVFPKEEITVVAYDYESAPWYGCVVIGDVKVYSLLTEDEYEKGMG